MRVTKKQLRRIIREELEQTQGYPGDGNEPVLSADELDLNEEDMNEAAGVLTIGAGVALGIAAVWGGVKLAGAAKSILGNMLHSAQRGLESKLRQLKGDLRQQVQTQMMETIKGDATLDQLAKEYQELTYQVQTKPMRAAKAGGPKRGGIKGLRGPEHAAVRKQQKAKAKELADYLDSALTRAWESVDPKLTKQAAKHLGSYDIGRTYDNVRKYGRRDR